MIEDLRRMLVIVEEGSITRAADKLFLTQPALSHAINRVEHALGIKIFRHVGKKLVLTKKGSELLVVVERIVRLWDGIKQKKDSKPKEMCTIGVYDNAALVLSPLFKQYFASSLLELDIIIDNSEKLFSQLIYGILDICICVYDAEKTLPQAINLVTSYTESLVPVSAHNIDIALENLPFILYNRDSITRTYIDKAFTQHGVTPKTIAESTSPSFIKELALVGSGVALLPENFVHNELQNGTLRKVQLPFQFQRTIGIYKNTMNMSPTVATLLEEIRSNVLKYA